MASTAEEPSVALEGEKVEQTTAPHVIIIGAGCTGLLLAQGLAKAGISFEIFEKDASAVRTKSREWGMSIHWSREHLTSILPTELLARFSEAQVDPSIESSNNAGYTVPFYNGKTGEHIIAMPMLNAVRVSRRKFRQLLTDGIDIQYGESMLSCNRNTESEISVTFESGRVATGTIVVGTDGPRSAVRSYLPGIKSSELQQLPLVMYNLSVCYGDAGRAQHIRHLHPMNTVALHPQKSFSLWTSIQDVPDPNAPESWQFQLMPTWLDDGKKHFGGAEGLAELKDIAHSLAEPWRSSILWIPNDAEIPPPSRVAYWPTEAWDNFEGRMTLAGDAAHPLPPHRGQGLNHCIADVANLLTALKSIAEGANQKETIDAYDAELVKRGADEVENSRKNSLLVHDFEKFMESPVLRQGYAKSRVPPTAIAKVYSQTSLTSNLLEKERPQTRDQSVDRAKEKAPCVDCAERREQEQKKKEKDKAVNVNGGENTELRLMKEYRQKVHEMSDEEKRETQMRLVKEIEDLSKLMLAKSRELSEVLEVL